MERVATIEARNYRACVDLPERNCWGLSMLDPSLRNLIAKYNRPGPRYTSYPTALQFSPVADVEPYFEAEASGPLSLYVHLPFCESLCWFCACTTVITCSRDRADRYLDSLEVEMGLLAERINASSREVMQVHLGGGSPSFLTADQLARLCDLLRKHFCIGEAAEMSAELDPRTLTEEKVKVLAKGGFNRASLGIQDIRPEVQKAVHRIQPDELNRECIRWIREAGIPALNIDLIYGLPQQTVTSFRDTLEAILEYDADRLAVFSYAHVPWVAPAQKILEKKQLPDAESKFGMLLETLEFLTTHGYRSIGMDHYAKLEDALCRALDEGGLHRNFQGYTTLSGLELCGLGMSSISQTDGAYRQNEKELEKWHAALAEGRLPLAKGYLLTPEDRLRREVIMTLMCSGTVDMKAVGEQFGVSFRDHFAAALEQLREPEEDGLIEVGESSLKVTARGRYLLRNLAMPFDATLRSEPRRHAQTV
jgi:oxygen-independent coproporphyrinogen-3 oxidase